MIGLRERDEAPAIDEIEPPRSAKIMMEQSDVPGARIDDEEPSSPKSRSDEALTVWSPTWRHEERGRVRFDGPRWTEMREPLYRGSVTSGRLSRASSPIGVVRRAFHAREHQNDKRRSERTSYQRTMSKHHSR